MTGACNTDIDKYAFIGDGRVGDHVGRCMDDLGFRRVDVPDAEVVITYCTHLSALEDAYFDEEGLVKNAQPESYLIDLSASTPTLSREIAAVATVNDLKPIEAPLAVRDPLCAQGAEQRANVICFAAGEEDDVAAVRDIIDALASEVRYAGPSGSAQLAKAAYTVQMAAQLVGAVESDALFRAIASNGLMPSEGGDKAAVLLGAGAQMHEAVSGKGYDSSFTVSMFMSDVAASMAAADDAELILPQLEAALHLLELLVVIGGADMGLAALSLLYQEEAMSAAAGLDWTRAEGLYGAGGEEHAENIEDTSGYADGFGDFYEN